MTFQLLIQNPNITRPTYHYTVFIRLNAAAFITFELAERGGAYFIISARSYSINFTFASSHGAGGGYCGGAGSVRKGIAAAAHVLSAKYCKLLDETFLVSTLS